MAAAGADSNGLHDTDAKDANGLPPVGTAANGLPSLGTALANGLLLEATTDVNGLADIATAEDEDDDTVGFTADAGFLLAEPGRGVSQDAQTSTALSLTTQHTLHLQNPSQADRLSTWIRCKTAHVVTRH